MLCVWLLCAVCVYGQDLAVFEIACCVCNTLWVLRFGAVCPYRQPRCSPFFRVFSFLTRGATIHKMNITSLVALLKGGLHCNTAYSLTQLCPNTIHETNTHIFVVAKREIRNTGMRRSRAQPHTQRTGEMTITLHNIATRPTVST